MAEETTDNENPSSLSYLRDKSAVRGAFQDPASVRRRAALVQVESVLKKMQECVELQLTPEAKNWPTKDDYEQLHRNIVDVLDPRRNKRRKKNPRWNYAFAAVDNAHSGLLLKDRIKRFALRTAKIVESFDVADVPRSISAMISFDIDSYTKSQKEKYDLFRRAILIADGKIDADGSRAIDLFEQCPDDFRSIFPAGRIDSLPEGCLPLAEYAAAAEIARVHRAHNAQYKWLSHLGEFFSELRAEEFNPLQEQIARLAMVMGFEVRSEEWRVRKATRKRVKKHRARKKGSTGGVTNPRRSKSE